MSSNRMMYDNCAYEQRLNQSTGPGNYMMYPGKYENSAKCRMQLGQVGGNGVSIYDGNMVDLESDLLGINRQASQCNKSKYHPKCKRCNQCKNSGLPCGCLACTSKNLIHQPNCQMVNYKEVIMTPEFKDKNCGYNNRSKKDKLGGLFSWL
jgi:hypothetical protein